jgi:hypothetical protein
MRVQRFIRVLCKHTPLAQEIQSQKITLLTEHTHPTIILRIIFLRIAILCMPVKAKPMTSDTAHPENQPPLSPIVFHMMLALADG